MHCIEVILSSCESHKKLPSYYATAAHRKRASLACGLLRRPTRLPAKWWCPVLVVVHVFVSSICVVVVVPEYSSTLYLYGGKKLNALCVLIYKKETEGPYSSVRFNSCKPPIRRSSRVCCIIDAAHSIKFL